MGVQNEAAKTLREAADILRERGWVQNTLRDDLGRLCMIGAIDEVMDEKHAPSVWSLMRRSLVTVTGVTVTGTNPSRPIGEWNDKPDRTVDEVLIALEQAAELAEAAS